MELLKAESLAISLSTFRNIISEQEKSNTVIKADLELEGENSIQHNLDPIYHHRTYHFKKDLILNSRSGSWKQWREDEGRHLLQ